MDPGRFVIFVRVFSPSQQFLFRRVAVSVTLYELFLVLPLVVFVRSASFNRANFGFRDLLSYSFLRACHMG